RDHDGRRDLRFPESAARRKYDEGGESGDRFEIPCRTTTRQLTQSLRKSRGCGLKCAVRGKPEASDLYPLRQGNITVCSPRLSAHRAFFRGPDCADDHWPGLSDNAISRVRLTAVFGSSK